MLNYKLIVAKHIGGIGIMNIFKEFDAILSALKPSQYRYMWQLYNYDGSKHYTGKEKQLVFEEKDAQELIDFIQRQFNWQKMKKLTMKHYIFIMQDMRCLGMASYYLYAKNRNEVFSYRNPIMKNIQKEYEEYWKYWESHHNDKPLEDIIPEAIDAIERIIRSHIGKTANIKIGDYMEDDTLYTSINGRKRKTKANPDIKHLYDSLFPAKKYRMILDLYLQPDNNTVIDNAKSYGINIGRIIKGIHLAARTYFAEIKKDKQEAEYLQEVLDTTVYSDKDSIEMEQYINNYFIDGMYKIATKSGRSIRVGKILQAISKTETKNSSIINYAIRNYHLAKVSSTKNTDLVIVLSRHPYDIAGMSTDRGWSSCMNLDNGGFRYYVPSSIAGGVLIAYLCNKDDTNINHPLGRVLIKPYIKEGEEIRANPANFILRCSKAYGTFHKSYIKQLQDWLDKNWNKKVKTETGKYNLINMAYRENNDTDWLYSEYSDKWRPSVKIMY